MRTRTTAPVSTLGAAAGSPTAVALSSTSAGASWRIRARETKQALQAAGGEQGGGAGQIEPGRGEPYSCQWQLQEAMAVD